jgi:hypothetical protein
MWGVEGQESLALPSADGDSWHPLKIIANGSCVQKGGVKGFSSLLVIARNKFYKEHTGFV